MRSPSTDASCARPAPAGTARRSTRRAMPSSSRSRPLRRRCRRPVPSRRPSAGPIRLRIGLHTGTPLLTDEGYVGRTCIAPRASPPGHGGQVLVSSSTAHSSTATASSISASTGSRTSPPERVYQLETAGPAPPGLYRTNLPVPATSFLGRRKELDEVAEILRPGDVGLVTLTGPEGRERLAWRCMQLPRRRVLPRRGLVGTPRSATGRATTRLVARTATPGRGAARSSSRRSPRRAADRHARAPAARQRRASPSRGRRRDRATS